MKRKYYKLIKHVNIPKAKSAVTKEKEKYSLNESRRNHQGRMERYSSFIYDLYNESKNRKVVAETFQKNYKVNTITSFMLRRMKLFERGMWIGEAPNAELVLEVIKMVSEKQREYDESKRTNPVTKSRVKQIIENSNVKTISELETSAVIPMSEPYPLAPPVEIITEQPATEADSEKILNTEDVIKVETAELVHVDNNEEKSLVLSNGKTSKINELSVLWGLFKYKWASHE